MKSGTITNYHLSTPNNTWYTTSEVDEIIPFVDNQGNWRVNTTDIQVFSGGSDISYRLCRIDNLTDKNILFNSSVMFVGADSIDSTEDVAYNAIQILGVSGQKLRFKCNYK